jgi:endonuclease-3
MLEQIKRINKILIKYFGTPKRSKILPDPVDMLIGTILSQNTNDKNSYRAFQNLKANFRNWEELAKLPASKIEKLVKVAGLGKQKSKAIKNVLNGLLKKNKEITLNYLYQADDKKVIDELTKFPGVGIKTASCVLLFSMDRNICPVDTHVHRTLNRIGLVKTSTADKTFENLIGNIPLRSAHSFHTNLIRLGREVCKASKPGCSICPLVKLCTFTEKSFDKNVRLVKNDFMLLDNIN